MTTSDDILEQFEGMSAWKLPVMCASAAERAAPLFRRLGRPSSQATFEIGLNTAWEVATSASTHGTSRTRRSEGMQAVRSVMRSLKSLPEAQEDDPHRPAYFAGCALELLVRALEYAATSDVDKAKDCVYDIASLCDGIDVTLSAAPGETFVYDPGDPPPPGELEGRGIAPAARTPGAPPQGNGA